MQRHLYDYYSSVGHSRFSEQVLITFIDKTDTSDSLKRENYWSRDSELWSHMVLI